jgi:hypothetical protein
VQSWPCHNGGMAWQDDPRNWRRATFALLTAITLGIVAALIYSPRPFNLGSVVALASVPVMWVAVIQFFRNDPLEPHD